MSGSFDEYARLGGSSGSSDDADDSETTDSTSGGTSSGSTETDAPDTDPVTSPSPTPEPTDVATTGPSDGGNSSTSDSTFNNTDGSTDTPSEPEPNPSQPEQDDTAPSDTGTPTQTPEDIARTGPTDESAPSPEPEPEPTPSPTEQGDTAQPPESESTPSPQPPEDIARTGSADRSAPSPEPEPEPTPSPTEQGDTAQPPESESTPSPPEQDDTAPSNTGTTTQPPEDIARTGPTDGSADGSRTDQQPTDTNRSQSPGSEDVPEPEGADAVSLTGSPRERRAADRLEKRVASEVPGVGESGVKVVREGDRLVAELNTRGKEQYRSGVAEQFEQRLNTIETRESGISGAQGPRTSRTDLGTVTAQYQPGETGAVDLSAEDIQLSGAGASLALSGQKEAAAAQAERQTGIDIGDDDITTSVDDQINDPSELTQGVQFGLDMDAREQKTGTQTQPIPEAARERASQQRQDITPIPAAARERAQQKRRNNYLGLSGEAREQARIQRQIDPITDEQVQNLKELRQAQAEFGDVQAPEGFAPENTTGQGTQAPGTSEALRTVNPSLRNRQGDYEAGLDVLLGGLDEGAGTVVSSVRSGDFTGAADTLAGSTDEAIGRATSDLAQGDIVAAGDDLLGGLDEGTASVVSAVPTATAATVSAGVDFASDVASQGLTQTAWNVSQGIGEATNRKSLDQPPRRLRDPFVSGQDITELSTSAIKQQVADANAGIEPDDVQVSREGKGVTYTVNPEKTDLRERVAAENPGVSADEVVFTKQDDKVVAKRESPVTDVLTGGFISEQGEQKLRRAAGQFRKDAGEVADVAAAGVSLLPTSTGDVMNYAYGAADLISGRDLPAADFSSGAEEKFVRGAVESGLGAVNVFGLARTAESGVELTQSLDELAQPERTTEAFTALGTTVAAKATQKAIDNPIRTSGSLVSGAGLSVGAGYAATRLGSRLKSRVRTAGSTKIPLEDLAPQETVEYYRTDGASGEKFPSAQDPTTYEQAPAQAVTEQSQDFTPDVVKNRFDQAGLEGDAFLKKALDQEPKGPGGGRAAQGFESTPDETGIDPQNIGEEDLTNANEDQFAYENPGAFLSPSVSPYFFGDSDRSSRFRLRPGLPDFGSSGTGVIARTTVDEPDASNQLEFAREMARREGESGTFTKPPSEVNTGEIESVSPPGSEFVDVGGGIGRRLLRRAGIGSDFRTELPDGRRVPLRLVGQRDISGSKTPGNRRSGTNGPDNPAFRVDSPSRLSRGPDAPESRPAPTLPGEGSSSGDASQSSQRTESRDSFRSRLKPDEPRSGSPSERSERSRPERSRRSDRSRGRPTLTPIRSDFFEREPSPGSPGRPSERIPSGGTPSTPFEEFPREPGEPYRIPGSPGIPGTPGTPDTPDVPGIPGTPGVPETPPPPPPRTPDTPNRRRSDDDDPLDIGFKLEQGKDDSRGAEDDLTATGYLSETVAAIATGGSLEAGRAPSKETLRNQPDSLALVGELPTQAFVSGSEETQQDIQQTEDLLGGLEQFGSSDEGGFF